MAFVITESDDGSKGRAKRALDRPFERETDWKTMWDRWWTQVEQDAHQLCQEIAFDTGSLDSTIRVVSMEELGGHREPPVYGASSVIMTGQRDIYKDERAIVAGDPSVINPKTKKGVTYAQAVHDGHFSTSGRWIPPRPFLSMAIMQNLPYLDSLINEYTRREMKKVEEG